MGLKDSQITETDVREIGALFNVRGMSQLFLLFGVFFFLFALFVLQDETYFIFRAMSALNKASCAQ
jgi:hypothetical protein